MRVTGIFIAVFVLFTGLIFQAYADESEKPLPKWEVGVAVGAASLPQYMGSDERYLFVAPLPYLIYRGERVRVGRSGIRSELFGIDRMMLDISLGFGLPVRNSNRTRAGMPKLNFNLQAGPRLNWQMAESARHELTLRLPWRAVVDTSGDYLGWLSEPDLKWQYTPSSALKFRLTSGVLFGSRKYHDTYYGVAPAFVTAERPVYQARAGMHSISVTGSLSYRFTDTLTFFTALRYRNLSPGVIADSPLVRDHDYFSIAAGLAWSLWQSDETGFDD
ncbi:MAG: MipA/OmpV family protein [Mariprofundaceae bacterium]